MSNMSRVDICILGAGAGGLSVAAEYYTPMLFSKKIRWLVRLLAVF